DEAVLDRIAAGLEDDRDARGCRFRGKRRGCGPTGCNDGDAATNEIGSQRRQPIVPALRPSIFDCDVLALNVADFSETTAAAVRARRCVEGRTMEEADYRHRLLLGLARKRP